MICPLRNGVKCAKDCGLYDKATEKCGLLVLAQATEEAVVQLSYISRELERRTLWRT